MRIETAVTRLLGIDLPILQAGMSWASSCAALPLAVSRAGGLAGHVLEEQATRSSRQTWELAWQDVPYEDP